MTHPFIIIAYLDPGTGSVLLQLILASLLGVGVAVRIFWHKIVSLFKKPPETDKISDDDNGR